MTGSRPDDFTVTYTSSNGTLPPPHHYEYGIEIGPDGQGMVTLIPDYRGPDVPQWREAFSLPPGAMDRLFEAFAAAGLFTTEWREAEDIPVGGGSEYLEVTAAGRRIEVPSY